MTLVTLFETPAYVRDFPDPARQAAFRRQWHDKVASLLNTRSGPTGEFYDASEVNVEPVAEHHLTWMGFPRRLLVERFRDDRAAAFTAGEVRLSRTDPQDEYFEWRATRNAAGRIKRVTFVTELPEYWEALAAFDRPRLLQLYRELVSPAVTPGDLFPGPGSNPPYNPLNRWNTRDGIVHYIQRINTLEAATGLASNHVDYGSRRDNYDPISYDTNVDPRVVLDVGSLARMDLSITLREPIGIYMVGWDDTGWTKPDGSPVGNYWRVERGRPGMALRVSYEVPASEGFAVGDIRIGGRRIEHAGQLAEHITVMAAGLAGRRSR